ncbi:Acyltransferase family protein [Clostridium sp. C105KSO15]|nr:Acyltransferase family protein [Clostridium sp. C105KSO15]
MGLKKREVKYDYLRTLAVFAIIMVHAVPGETLNYKQWLFSAALSPVLLSFVGIYFMLSGLFLLKFGTEDIPGFYWSRLQTIVLPFVCYSGIYYWYYAIYLGVVPLRWQEHLAVFGKGLLTGTIPMTPHMWFMYVIMALYLCAPFLARMMKAMSERELKLFLALMVIVQGICTYLPALGLDIGEGVQYMLFKGWFIYFVLGYALKRLYVSSSYLPFAVLGIAGFGITMVQKCVTPSFTPGIHDLAPTMMAMAAAIFMFFEHFGDIKAPVLAKVVSFISRYSYSIYLIHYLVLGQAARGLVEKTFLRHYYVPKIFCETILTFLISLAAAWIIDGTIGRLLKKAVGAIYYRRKNA